MNEKEAIQFQRAYYTQTAQKYNQAHMNGKGEHDLACSLIHGLSMYYDFQSILDIGSGTGRALLELTHKLPDVRIIGIEPVAALREIGYENGMSRDNLIEGDATHLQYADNSFDLVCECAVLHHIPQPRLVVAEMLRVAKKAIFFGL